MVETVGLEPTTSCMWSKRSDQLSYASTTCTVIIVLYFPVVNWVLKNKPHFLSNGVIVKSIERTKKIAYYEMHPIWKCSIDKQISDVYNLRNRIR